MKTQNLSPAEKRLLAEIQGDLPLCLNPFAAIAEKSGWKEADVLRAIEAFMRRGTIRRFGAILRHQKAGIQGNAMVVWRVPDERVLAASRTMVSFPAVSHCYLRSACSEWPFNLYTMVHGRTEADCRRTARQLSTKLGIRDYRILFSRKEHKKSSMTYF